MLLRVESVHLAAVIGSAASLLGTGLVDWARKARGGALKASKGAFVAAFLAVLQDRQEFGHEAGMIVHSVSLMR